MSTDPIRIREYPTHPALAPYVKCVWSLESDRPIHDSTRERILPDSCVELGAYLFFHRPLREVAAGVVDLADLWPDRAREWTDRLTAACSMPSRIRLVEQLLRPRLREGCDVSCLQPIKPEPRLREERRHVPRHVEAHEWRPVHRLPPALPAPDVTFGRPADFVEDQLALGAQYPGDPAKSVHDAIDHAESEGAHHGVDACLRQRMRSPGDRGTPRPESSPAACARPAGPSLDSAPTRRVSTPCSRWSAGSSRPDRPRFPERRAGHQRGALGDAP